jgi:hypothetical protein
MVLCTMAMMVIATLQHDIKSVETPFGGRALASYSVILDACQLLQSKHLAFFS